MTLGEGGGVGASRLDEVGRKERGHRVGERRSAFGRGAEIVGCACEN